MKKNSFGLLIAILFIAFAAVAWLANSGTHDRPNFTTFSNNEYGISLLFDTLAHMGQPVRQLYHPTASVHINDVVVVVQPRHNLIHGEDMHNWLRRGGRMIFLDNRPFNALSDFLTPLPFVEQGSLRLYRVGNGSVVTAAASLAANINLMHDPEVGDGIVSVLNYWQPENIWFAEYYHGFGVTTSAFGQMPLWIRLATVQIIIIAAAFAWHKGKRFGRPVPLYEEIEREEHEQVYTLARLYRWADKRRGGRGGSKNL